MTAQELIERANSGYVGINEGGEVSSGYDESHHGASGPDKDDLFEPEEMLPYAERVALADIMLDRWRRYKDEAMTQIYSMTHRMPMTPR